jgi:hypothetical protein
MFFAFFRRIEVDLHDLIVYTNKWTVNPNRQGFDHETDCTTQHRHDLAIDDVPDRQELRRTIDFRLTFPYYGSVRQWLPYSIWIQPLPERGSHQCGPYSSAFVLSGTGYRAPGLCTPGAQRRPTESKSAKCC